MLRDYPWIIFIMFLGIVLIIVTGVYYQQNNKQDSIVLGLTETVRTCAITNADNSSRLNKGELLISKEKFEKDFKDRIVANNKVVVSNDSTYIFEYLENTNGSIKGIRVLIKEGDVTYQATTMVDISDL